MYMHDANINLTAGLFFNFSAFIYIVSMYNLLFIPVNRALLRRLELMHYYRARSRNSSRILTSNPSEFNIRNIPRTLNIHDDIANVLGTSQTLKTLEPWLRSIFSRINKIHMRAE